MLQQTVTVYQQMTLVEDETVIFYQPNDDDTDLVDREIAFSLDDWHDMGSPLSITVTIQPGDLLN